MFVSEGCIKISGSDAQHMCADLMLNVGLPKEKTLQSTEHQHDSIEESREHNLMKTDGAWGMLQYSHDTCYSQTLRHRPKWP